MIFEVIAWAIVLSVVSNMFYRKGIKAGIKHSLLTLNLTQDQVNILNQELKKDVYDLEKETLNEIPKKVIN
jgi:hypothetical protein|tara:strand:- start:238 stop:450 length:213 start_codon:yes stop_codon:yes gene_type:complete